MGIRTKLGGTSPFQTVDQVVSARTVLQVKAFGHSYIAFHLFRKNVIFEIAQCITTPPPKKKKSPKNIQLQVKNFVHSGSTPQQYLS